MVAADSTIDLAAIRRFLRRAPYLHAYELGDLDPREAAHTTWLASDPVDAVALIYRGLAVPTLIALADGDPAALLRLIGSVVEVLPPKFYAHLTAGIESVLASRYQLSSRGDCYKMALVGPPAGDDPGAKILRLGPEHADQAARFYAAHYPAGYFEPATLERGPYLAILDGDGIAAIAGVHVYAPAERVASLGNIATRGDARGKGFARRVTAALCRLLRDEIDILGLNVRAENAAAIACYRSVGFEVRHAYSEWRVESSSDDC
jgi:ribosomal protein S18 acetylase RimI-like enzyme